MIDFSFISIILYSVSAFLFVVFVIIFFMTDVLESIRFIKQKNKSFQTSDMIMPTISITKNSQNTEHNIKNFKDTEQKHIATDNIEIVCNTTDIDNYIENIESFDTLDCDFSGDISFVLTRNIVICHNDNGD